MKKLLKITLYFLAAVIGIVIIANVTDDKTAPQSPTEKTNEPQIIKEVSINEPVEESPKIEAKYSKILNSVDEFKKNFNNFSTKNDFDWRVKSITITDGNVYNTFKYMFNDNIGVVGTLNKSDNSITSLLMIGSSDGSEKSGADIIVAAACVIASLDKDLSDTERENILRKTVLKTVDDGGKESKTIFNNITYTASISKFSGFLLSIEKSE